MWAEADGGQLSEIMLEVSGNHTVARIKGEQGRRDIVEKWSMEIMGRQFLSKVEEAVERKANAARNEL